MSINLIVILPSFVLGILWATTHLAQRSLFMRGTVQWQLDSREWGKSLTELACDDLLKASWLSTNMACLMFSCCSLAPHSSNCELFSYHNNNKQLYIYLIIYVPLFVRLRVRAKGLHVETHFITTGYDHIIYNQNMRKAIISINQVVCSGVPNTF